MADRKTAIDILLELRDRVSGPLNSVQDKLREAREKSEALRGALDGVASAGRNLAVVGLAMGALVVGGVAQAANFQTAMAEVSTLVDTNVVNMAALSDQVKRLSGEYGSMPVDTAKAYYQTISAGFGDAAAATAVMTAGLQLAKGGLTDTFTAVDGLTSVLNAYGLAADDAISVSDSFFVTVKKGKTTVGELASSLGQVAALAAPAGVSLDEMNAAVAALTLGGNNTSEAVTGLRGMISAIIKPTSEAAKLAEKLGIDFSTAGVRAAGGFANWLETVREATGGSDDKLGLLFSDVQGLAAALALTGKQAGNFAEILDEMAAKSGATAVAYNKIDAIAKAAFDKSKAKLMVAIVSAFESLLPAATMAMNAVSSVMGAFGDLAMAHPTLTKIGVSLFSLNAVALITGGMFIWVAGSIAGAVLNLANLVEAVGGMAKLAPILNTIGSGFRALGAALSGALLSPIGLVAIAVLAFAGYLYLLYRNFDYVHGVMQKIPGPIAVLAATLMPLIGIPLLVIKYWDQLKSWWSSFAGWWAASGAGLVDSFVAGLTGAWGKVIDTVRRLMGRLREFFWGSDPKAGPMMRTTWMGSMLPETLAVGMRANAGVLLGAFDDLMGYVRPRVAPAATAGPRAAVAPARGGNRIGSVVINVTGNSGSPREIERAVAGVLRRYSFEVGA
jgi:TP901 family phage tail tape measure protein